VIKWKCNIDGVAVDFAGGFGFGIFGGGMRAFDAVVAGCACLVIGEHLPGGDRQNEAKKNHA